MIKQRIGRIQANYEIRQQQLNAEFERNTKQLANIDHSQVKALESIISNLDIEKLFEDYCVLMANRGKNYDEKIQIINNFAPGNDESAVIGDDELDISTEDTDETKNENLYIKLRTLLTHKFLENNALPKFILAIDIDETKYPDLKLPKSEYEIPSPENEINSIQGYVNEVKTEINKTKRQSYNKYLLLINKILAFVYRNDALFMFMRLNPSNKMPESIKRRFINEAKELDNEISASFPSLTNPISKVITKYNLDSELDLENEIKKEYNANLLNLYRAGLAEVFKYIAMGIGNFK